MRLVETALSGVWIVEPEPIVDDRGFFAPTSSARVFTDHGLNPSLPECSVSWNRLAGTLRGLHYQRPPHAEAKLVRCTRGKVFDVALDLRAGSRSFGVWVGVELTSDNRHMLYVPEGCAHGFQTLADDSEVFYQISREHEPDFAAGVRWDDPAFGVSWPLRITVISERDRDYEDYRPDS